MPWCRGEVSRGGALQGLLLYLAAPLFMHLCSTCWPRTNFLRALSLLKCQQPPHPGRMFPTNQPGHHPSLHPKPECLGEDIWKGPASPPVSSGCGVSRHVRRARCLSTHLMLGGPFPGVPHSHEALLSSLLQGRRGGGAVHSVLQ